VGPGFSPLDERLGLLAGSSLTPWLCEGIVRLGACVPFAQVAPLVAHFTGVAISPATVRRLTEAAGAAQVTLETQAVAQLERDLPDPAPGPAVQLLSVDGAMVPLVGGRWAEVKTLALGTVTAIAVEGGAAVVVPRTTDLSYFSRLADATTFGRLATVATQRRGTTTAGTVVAVVDGAAWCQGFIDLQRPDAVRILDFAHAVEHLGLVAQTLYGPGTAAAGAWLAQQAQALRHGQEQPVIAHLAELANAPGHSAEVRALLTATHAYFASRQAQIRYHTFVAAGYPIGSGCIESANKLVVEARLKGSGMHWAAAQVNPMLALRTVLCNGCWETTWPSLWDQWRQPTRRRRPSPPSPPDSPPAPPNVSPATIPLPTRPKLVIDGKPTRDHPWRRFNACAAKR
jgi:hypothetical protein